MILDPTIHLLGLAFILLICIAIVASSFRYSNIDNVVAFIAAVIGVAATIAIIIYPS